MEYSTALSLGLKLREYKILGVLGHGAFGITYLAIDKNLNKRVAIKEYFPNHLAVRIQHYQVAPKTLNDKDNYHWGLQQFLNEAKILATFEHANIVKVHCFFQMNSTAYFVMEYAQGRTLSEAITEIEANNETISEQDVKQLLFPLLDSLKIIHQTGYLHRDIKPANIYIRDSDSQPMLLDFGAARFSLGHHSKSISTILTPGYAPVEQYQTSLENQGPWTDIYALAATMYRLLTGQTPIDAFTRYTSITDKKQDALPPIVHSLRGQFSPSFINALMYGLNIQKEQRPQSSSEWKAAFLAKRDFPPPPIEKKPLNDTTSPPQTGKHFEVYEHPVFGYKAIKKGFAWGMLWGALFLIILVIMLGVKKMWGHIFAVLAIIIAFALIGGSNLITSSDFEMIGMFMAITISLLYGFLGNRWYANSLIKKGYTLVDVVKSPNIEAAIAIAVKNNI